MNNIETLNNNQWDCTFKGIKIFEELTAALLLVGVGLLVYNFLVQDHATFAGLLQTLFFAFWIGLFGLVSSILMSTIFFIRARTTCRTRQVS